MFKFIKSEAEKVTYIGGVVNLILSIIKIAGGILFHSAGLVADGIHSLSDLISDAMVVIVLRISGKKPDADHPWGHGRFETLGTALLGAALIFLGGIIAYNSILSLINPHSIAPVKWPALLAVTLSIFSKEWLYFYTLKVGRRIQSDLLIANAWHHRSDSLSSIAVLIGLIGALLGYVWLDYVAAIAVAALIFKVGFSIAYKSFTQLVDTALPLEEVENLTKIAKSVEGVISVHDFKTRGTGSKTILEMHIQVDPFISSSEGHQIGESVVHKLEKRAKEIDIAHVIYHIDTFDDRFEKHSDYSHLPLREQIKPIIEKTLANLKLPESFQIILYYHNKKVGIMIVFDENWFELNKKQPMTGQLLAEKIENQLNHEIQIKDWLHRVKIATLIEK